MQDVNNNKREFSLKSLSIIAVLLVAFFGVALIYTTSQFFYNKIVERVIEEKIILMQSVRNIIVQPFWRFRIGLNVGFGATRVLIIETAKTPDVVFFRIVDTESGRILFSSISEEEAKEINNIPELIGIYMVRRSRFNSEPITEIIMEGDAGQNLWMGISNKGIRAQAFNFIIQEIVIVVVALILLIILLTLINRKAIRNTQQYQQALKEEKKKIEKKVKKRTTELEKVKLGLEKEINRRTIQLQEKLRELEKFNKTMVDRELKMIELKKEIKKLKDSLNNKD